MWLARDDNTEASPGLATGPSGKRTVVVRSRLLLREAGYQKYMQDAKDDSQPFYCRSEFFSHELQKDIRDTKIGEGLCNSCLGLGYSSWKELAALIKSLDAAVLAPDTHASLLAEVKALRDYFGRGGPYWSKLELFSSNAHHCITHALSSPTATAFAGECTHGAHTHVDVMVLRRDEVLAKTRAALLRWQNHLLQEGVRGVSGERVVRSVLSVEGLELDAEAKLSAVDVQVEGSGGEKWTVSTAAFPEKINERLVTNILQLRQVSRLETNLHNYLSHLLLDKVRFQRVCITLTLSPRTNKPR